LKRSTGFTLIEVLYCIAIIVIVAAVLFPVFGSAKHSAHVTVSKSNLHQMYIAATIYQAAQSSTVQYGSLAEMGLPSGETVYQDLKLAPEIWISPCGLNPSWAPGPVRVQYEYYAQTSFTKWEDAVSKYHDNAVLFVDMNCADHGEPLRSDFIVHRGLGVRLSGQIIDLHKRGNYGTQLWWAE